jgi:hypothetical protein
MYGQRPVICLFLVGEDRCYHSVYVTRVHILPLPRLRVQNVRVPDEIVDLLKALFVRNEQYHDVKERVVWLAGVIYLTFSAALIGWYLKSDVCIPCQLKKPVLFALSAIFVLTVAFIIRQIREKVHSTVITWQHFTLMKKLPNHRNHIDLMIANTYNHGMCEAFWDFVQLGWSGHLILGVVSIFFLAQLTVICEVSISWLLWAGIPIVTILFPLIVSWCRRGKQYCKTKERLRAKNFCEVKKKLRNLTNWLDP